MALSLTKQVARDGEGATKLIEVHVDGAASDEQAKRVAKAIVNSPLVKTAVHGADPNWGRVAMAVGKATTADEVDQSAVTIRFGAQEVYPARVDDPGRAVGLHEGRRRAHPRVASAAGDVRVDGLGLRPHRRLRQDQRRLHDVRSCAPHVSGAVPPDDAHLDVASPRRRAEIISAACGCRRRRGWSRRSCSCS